MIKKRNSSSGRPGRIPLFQGILWAIAGLVVLSAVLGYLLWPPSSPPKSPASLLYEEPPEPAKGQISKPVPLERPRETLPSLPKIAIVIDDLGYDRQTTQGFIEVNAPLTLSFLPWAPHSREMAGLAKTKGKEVLLHLPMEPRNYPETNPGPGAFLLGMSEEDLRRAVEKDITAFPFVTGANNHMGSRFTEDREKMTPVLLTLKKHRMYFMDSLTTPHSVVPSLAKELDLPYVQRNVFLDNEVRETPIKQQLDKLVRVAQTRGVAVGSAHPYPLSLKIIRESLPALREQVQIVSLSELIQQTPFPASTGKRTPYGS